MGAGVMAVFERRDCVGCWWFKGCCGLLNVRRRIEAEGESQPSEMTASRDQILLWRSRCLDVAWQFIFPWRALFPFSNPLLCIFFSCGIITDGGRRLDVVLAYGAVQFFDTTLPGKETDASLTRTVMTSRVISTTPDLSRRPNDLRIPQIGIKTLAQTLLHRLQVPLSIDGIGWMSRVPIDLHPSSTRLILVISPHRFSPLLASNHPSNASRRQLGLLCRTQLSRTTAGLLDSLSKITSLF